MSRRILIVEDHHPHERLIVAELRAAGFEVTAVHTGEAALQRMIGASFDCVVVDHKLPLISGIEMIRAARTHGSMVPMILVASALLPEVERDALRAGAFRCVAKHLNFLPALVRTIHDALGGTALEGALRVIPRVMVGRDTEQNALADMLTATCEGRGQVVYVLGDEGFGKTTLMRWVVERARLQSGILALVARCRPEHSPYALWFEIHRAYVRTTGRATSIDAEVAQLTAAPETWNVPPAQAQRAKMARFERVAQCLHEIAADQPLLLVLDDLHLVDSASLEFLEYVAGQLSQAPFSILGAYRPSDARLTPGVADQLDRLRNDNGGTMLQLGALSESDVSRYVEESVGKRVEPDFALALFEKTDGNPLWVSELFRLVISANPNCVTLAPAMLGRLPASQLAAVDQRLGQLPAASLEWLAKAAVHGRQFDRRLVLEAAGAEAEAADAALAEACRLGVLIVDEESGEYRFHAELTRDAALKRLTRSERCEWHAAIGHAIERLHERTIDAWLPSLARHFLEAGWERDPDVGIDYACRAGEQLSLVLAWPEAAELFGGALRLDDRWRILTPAERLRIRNRHADVLWRAGRFEAARQAGKMALDEADATRDPEGYLKAALNFASPLPGYGAIVKDPDVMSALSNALRRTTDQPGSVRPVVIASYADRLAFTPEGAHGRELFAAALAAARRSGSLAIEADTLRQGQWILWTLPRPQRDALIQRMLDLASQTRDPALANDAELMRVLCAFEAGQLVAARQGLATCTIDANKWRMPYPMWLAKVTEAFVAIGTGQFDDGVRLAGDAVAIGQACGNPNAALFSAVQMGHVLWLRGEFDAVLAWLDQVGNEVPALGMTVRLSRALTLCELARVDEASAIVDGLGRNPVEHLPTDVTRVMNLAYLGEIATRTGNREVAGAVFRELSEFADHNVLLPPLFSYGPVAHHLAVIAAGLGRFDEAAKWFDAALEMATRSEASHWIARTKVERAAMLVHLERGAEAASVLAEAGPLAGRLGLVPLSARIAELETKCDSTRSAGRRIRRWIFRLLPGGKKLEVGIAGGPTVTLDMLYGYRYIWELLRRPDTEVDARDLHSGAAGSEVIIEGMLESVLDPEARRQLRGRLQDLLAQRAEAVAANDHGWLEKINAETDQITRELRCADQPNGTTSKKKAQETVQKAFAKAFKTLHDHPVCREIGEFLRRQIHTGYTCGFSSHPDWEFVLA